MCRLTYREIAVSCGGQLELTESVREGVVSSPSYPDLYPQNVDCIWQIMAPAGQQIQLDFQQGFSIEPHDK